MSRDASAAAELAEELLTPLADRWTHVQAVAKRASEVCSVVDDDERELLVAAAWLHDVGYAPAVKDTGFHPIDGARYVDRLGWPPRIVALVAHHSCARIEAEVRGLVDELRPYPLEESPLMDALVYADMTTGPRGQRYTFDERIDEILTRYQPESEVHQAISRARPILAASVERVEDRLGAS